MNACKCKAASSISHSSSPHATASLLVIGAVNE
ncbi:uncharacterized protein G2W53_019057 [Senna tora]|uniref:Uncharacterized protein n=1 Tax=Senna tora TaxID=362788 RepID=A0A834TSZ1_9FABA|nr:uncharacterized protein G2W53_019057 [Senna tora]